ncbi:PFDN2 [Bugula neritina]|uniref:PFDN2 n=1 Tax=Bugula neritina TaxID=10212 RepID=A0A7J7K0N9_BUGNE|nr:PFDN2 [Bugula neritina]
MATETKSKVPNQEQIINGFNQLRNQQRQIVMKISEITDERKEHQMVYETLKDTEKDRACFRMVGGVLVKLTVGEVVPSLQNTIEQMGKLLDIFIDG